VRKNKKSASIRSASGITRPDLGKVRFDWLPVKGHDSSFEAAGQNEIPRQTDALSPFGETNPGRHCFADTLGSGDDHPK